MCKPDILYILDRAHGLDFFEGSRIRSPFLDNARHMETITELCARFVPKYFPLPQGEGYGEGALEIARHEEDSNH